MAKPWKSPCGCLSFSVSNQFKAGDSFQAILCFFGNSSTPDFSVSREEKRMENQDSLFIRPLKISSFISEIHIVATLRSNKQDNFNHMGDVFFDVTAEQSGECLGRHLFYNAFTQETAIELGTFYRDKGRWHFLFSGKKYQGDLMYFLIKYYPKTLPEAFS
ncbi:MAG: TerD family protein [Flavobacteriales bacterium]